MAQFTNQAQLSYNGTVINSNITVGEFREELTAEKHAVTENYVEGDEITYVVSVVNTGGTAQSGVTVTDDLGSYIAGGSTVYPLTYVAGSATYYQNGELQAAPNVASAAPLRITGLTVPAGGSVVLIYKAAVNEFAPPVIGGTVTNTAVIDGAGITTPITVSETVSALEGARLSIEKTLTPTVITGSGTLTYTLAIRNLGPSPATAADNIVITDTFNPILRGMTVTYNGAPFPASSYTYSEATGVFRTVGGRITVPAATYTQNPFTGAWTVTPGITTVAISGTV